MMPFSRAQQVIFDRYLEMNDRPSGSALATEYKRGLDGHRTAAHRDSLAFAAYQAGISKRNIARKNKYA